MFIGAVFTPIGKLYLHDLCPVKFLAIFTALTCIKLLGPKDQIAEKHGLWVIFSCAAFFPRHHKSRSKLKTCSVHQRTLINILFQPTLTCCRLLLMELITHWLFLIKCHWRYDLELSVDGIAARPPPAPLLLGMQCQYIWNIMSYTQHHSQCYICQSTLSVQISPMHTALVCIWNNWRICFHPTTYLTGRMVIILVLRLLTLYVSCQL